MPHKQIELLKYQMEEAYQMVWDRLQGVTDDEYFWQPVPDCWTVFRQANGRWTYHYELPTPQPHPFTSIAWRVTHIALCKIMYHEYAFGPAELTWHTIETPSSVAEALAVLARGQRLLIKELANLSGDADLDVLRRTNWGETWPTWRIFWTMIHHDAQHGGEIGCIRDLYLYAQR
jgi:DinB superfamily